MTSERRPRAEATSGKLMTDKSSQVKLCIVHIFPYMFQCLFHYFCQYFFNFKNCGFGHPLGAPWGPHIFWNWKQYLQKKSNIFKLWNENKLVVFSKIDSSKIDLIISLYKSFEVGIGNKEIIKKNIAVLGFSISKVFKEFRYDVINEFKKKEKIFMRT